MLKMLGWLFDQMAGFKESMDAARLERRWERLRRLGMHIGEDVLLPATTNIDVSHCFLISIGDHCGFGPECVILAHDAQMDEFLDAARIGKVIVHPSCHIGARTVILPGVEIGPRTIVGANSVVSKSLPPDTVCSGSPAQAVCTLEEYLQKHRQRLQAKVRFEYSQYDIRSLTPERRRELMAAVAEGDAYIVGGRTAELEGRGGTQRTPSTKGNTKGPG